MESRQMKDLYRNILPFEQSYISLRQIFECMEYRKRIADQMLADKLDAMGAVLIEGPKACGKTTTAEQHAKIVYG